MSQPTVVIVAGPNGAGKSTLAPVLLRDTLGVVDYVNADVVALGLSGFDPATAGLAAGRVVLDRLRALASQRRSFAFETTLATRSFAPWLAELTRDGYAVALMFLWLPGPDAAIVRVRNRVALGGHDVPEDTVRRRYERGLANFFGLYRARSSDWRFYDSSGPGPRLVASGSFENAPRVEDPALWGRLRAENDPAP